MATAIVNDFNIFVDSGRYRTTSSKGDDIHVPLAQTPISCHDNQHLKLTLQDFNMVKNFSNVNVNNNTFSMAFQSTGNPTVVSLTEQNYRTIHDLAVEFSNKVGEKFTEQGYQNVAVQLNAPLANTDKFGNTDNIIKFTIETTTTISNKIPIFFDVNQGDAYELLGGNLSENPRTAEDEIGVLAANGLSMTYECPYPAQRFTEEHVYLRTDLPSTNLETMGYSSGSTDGHSTHMNSSRILGKIPIKDSIVSFHTQTGNEYTISLKQKNFTMMRLHLTDSHGRELPFKSDTKKRSNLNFKCTIKVEIVQYLQPQNHQLKTERPEKTVPARFGTAPLDYFEYGAPRKNR